MHRTFSSRALAALSTGVDPTEALNAAVVDAPGSVGDDVAALGEAFATAAASVDDTAFLADEVGVMLPAAPGEDSVLLTDLAAGDYVVVCVLPVGTTTIDQVRALDNFGSLDDHRSQGMISAFSVG